MSYASAPTASRFRAPKLSVVTLGTYPSGNPVSSAWPPVARLRLRFDAVSAEEVPAITLDVDRQGAGAVVTVGGELEFGTAASLRTLLIELAHEAVDPVVVDLAGIEFIDSTGLSLLVQAKQRFESQGRRFALRRPPHRV